MVCSKVMHERMIDMEFSVAFAGRASKEYGVALGD